MNVSTSCLSIGNDVWSDKKSVKLRNIITYNIIWAKQKAKLFALQWLDTHDTIVRNCVLFWDCQSIGRHFKTSVDMLIARVRNP